MGRRHILKDFRERGFDPTKAHSQLDAGGRLVGDSPRTPKAVAVESQIESGPDLVAVQPVAEEVELELARARENDGQFAGDDPATPDVNEAWVEAPGAPEEHVLEIEEPEEPELVTGEPVDQVDVSEDFEHSLRSAVSVLLDGNVRTVEGRVEAISDTELLNEALAEASRKGVRSAIEARLEALQG